MAGPFPGMDPFLEFESSWADFHHCLVAGISSELGTSLPDCYVARINERTEVERPWIDAPGSDLPEVPFGRHSGGSIVPELVEISDRDYLEVRITWVEVRALPEMTLVTAIEVLSPINKAWQGRQSYLDKRDKLHASRVNLVEIDLLLGGAPLPMKRAIKPGAYSAIVARGARLPVAEVDRWSVRDALPRLPIPLREPDPDAWIDPGTPANRVYDLGRYARTLRHQAPLPEAASPGPEDRAWVEAVVGRA